MRIDELPPELQELCYQRQKEQGQMGTYTGDLAASPSQGNFLWNKCPGDEGDMWLALWEGKDITGYSCYPKRKEVNCAYSIY